MVTFRLGRYVIFGSEDSQDLLLEVICDNFSYHLVYVFN